jgi:hypothetical protein
LREDRAVTERTFYVGPQEIGGFRPEDVAELEGPYESLETAIAAWQADPDLADALAVYACEPRGRLEAVAAEELGLMAHLVAEWVDVGERLPREGERIRFVTGGMPPREHVGWYDAAERYFCSRDERGVVRRWRTQVLRWQLVVETAGGAGDEGPASGESVG